MEGFTFPSLLKNILNILFTEEVRLDGPGKLKTKRRKYFHDNSDYLAKTVSAEEGKNVCETIYWDDNANNMEKDHWWHNITLFILYFQGF